LLAEDAEAPRRWATRFSVIYDSSVFHAALRQGNLSIDMLNLDHSEMLRRGEAAFILPLFRAWFNTPLRVPDWEAQMRAELQDAGLQISKTLTLAASAVGAPSRRFLIPPTPLEKYQKEAEGKNSLPRALVRLNEVAATAARAMELGEIPPLAFTVEDYAQQLSAIPLPMQKAAALIALAAADALVWRQAAFRRCSGEQLRQRYAAAMVYPQPEDEAAEAKISLPSDLWRSAAESDFIALVDFRRAYAGWIDLTAAAEQAAADLVNGGAEKKFRFEVSTALGRLIFAGSGNDVYQAGEDHIWLVIDAGGDDRYECGGASGDLLHPIGIILDLSGDDRYVANERLPAQAAGVFGFGLIMDMGGNDSYSAAGRVAQGAGLFGVGILCDIAGDDRYECEGFGQAAAYCGIGLLLDGGGHDVYRLYQYGQAFGGTLGVGILLDVAGNDRYEADDQEIRFPSAQSDKHNCSMAQGAASGERRDYVDGHDLAGGVGFLLDLAGDDQYSAGVFGQAVGYLYGIGILDDRQGNDRYQGVWYAQSATAHAGISLLAEGGGDDVYASAMCMRLGAAHDFSLSIFLEEGGNDRYEAAGSGFGQALHNSLALFFECGGDDSYGGALSSMANPVNASPPGTARGDSPTTGIFLDLAGADSYGGKGDANGTAWVFTPPPDAAFMRGVAVDGPLLEQERHK